MKQVAYSMIMVLFNLLSGVLTQVAAQPSACTFKEPVVNIDFGTGNDLPDINPSSLPNYQLVQNACPTDGHYAFVAATSDCFHGDWLTFNGDHTAKGKNGRMMLVNASPSGGVFFNTTLKGLKGNTTYQLAAWMTNVCRISGGCPPLPPNITIRLVTPAGKEVISFHTGLLQQRAAPHWTRYEGMFTTPANVTTLLMTMEDRTIGWCGNDFALDDITVRECVPPAPVTKVDAKPVMKKEAPLTKQLVKKAPVNTQPVKRETTLVPIEKGVTDSPKVPMPAIKEKPVLQPAPLPISTRANPIIKQLETDAGEIVINLYDNGEIDGDTVSVYHNNELLVSKAGLSAKPVSFHIVVDAAQPHHELVMVANNLGSIPPNTSLMVIKAGNKQYEVLISSSEQKNAKVVIDLKQ